MGERLSLGLSSASKLLCDLEHFSLSVGIMSSSVKWVSWSRSMILSSRETEPLYMSRDLLQGINLDDGEAG